MKRIFVDTNIILDLLSKREPFYQESADLFSLADKKVIEIYISSLSIANTNYTLTRLTNSESAKVILRKLRLIVNILALDDKVIGLALNDNSFADFEDGLQYFTAIENNIDTIVTRNLKDFKAAKIPVLTAKQFIGTLD
jgi:predicted nucleic acid-binding protein